MWNGWNLRAVAKRRGISEAVVRKRLSHGKRLRRRFAANLKRLETAISLRSKTQVVDPSLDQAWLEQQQQSQSGDLSFDERLAMLVERQWIWKENRALATRLKFAQLKQSACLEDIDYRYPRGLKRAVVEQLASCEWIRHNRHCIITGPTGVGILSGLCPGAQSLSGALPRPLLLWTQTLPRPQPGPGRRQSHTAAQETGPSRSAGRR